MLTIRKIKARPESEKISVVVWSQVGTPRSADDCTVVAQAPALMMMLPIMQRTVRRPNNPLNAFMFTLSHLAVSVLTIHITVSVSVVPKNSHIGFTFMSKIRQRLAREAQSHIRTRKTKGKEYQQTYLFIPKLVATDTAFPFSTDEAVTVTIDTKKRRLIVEKADS